MHKKQRRHAVFGEQRGGGGVTELSFLLEPDKMPSHPFYIS
jgi:hypothetical protein